MVFKITITIKTTEFQHYNFGVRAFLNVNFMVCIGRRGTIEWSAQPRSPDLTPYDFGTWRLLTDKVFAVKPQNLVHLKELVC